MARILLLTEGFSNPDKGKTAASILRYRAEEVVAVIDSGEAGRAAQELFGVGGSIPVVASISAAAAVAGAGAEPDELIVGVAPSGRKFPEAWRKIILEAITRGMNITSGVHVFLSEDHEIAGAARTRGVRLWDVRTPPDDLDVSVDMARKARALRVHTVGLDCSVGKMTVSIELDRAMRRRGANSKFLATGQTGIMITGEGLPIDRIISDFVAGAAERLILENQDREVLHIEGQGSLYHPYYSGVTLGLLHGSAPDLLVMCYKPARKCLIGTDRPMASLREAVELYERMAGIIHPCRVIGVALNSLEMTDDAARAELERASRETGLPAADVVRFGAEPLVDAIMAAKRASEAP